MKNIHCYESRRKDYSENENGVVFEHEAGISSGAHQALKACCLIASSGLGYHQNYHELICDLSGLLGEIVKTDGVDGIFIGPFDLSISMGIPGDFTNPAFQNAIRKILEVCHENGKFCVLFTNDEAGVNDGFAKGYDSMTYGLDAGLIIDCLRERLARIRNASAPR